MCACSADDEGGAFCSVAQQRPGVNVNELSDEERYDPLTQNSALNGVPVELSPHEN